MAQVQVMGAGMSGLSTAMLLARDGGSWQEKGNQMTTTMRRRGMALAGAAVFALSGMGLSSPAGATDSTPLEDCFGSPLVLGSAIAVPANSTGWTNGTSGDDVIIGTDGPDLIDGKGGNDRICGGGGDDEIHGNSGDDMIKGEGGADEIHGNGDVDFLLGDAGADTIHGGDGGDFLDGERGDDELYGEDGEDALLGSGEASGVDDFDCGLDQDTVIFDLGTDEVSNCENRVEYTGPSQDGD